MPWQPKRSDLYKLHPQFDHQIFAMLKIDSYSIPQYTVEITGAN